MNFNNSKENNKLHNFPKQLEQRIILTNKKVKLWYFQH